MNALKYVTGMRGLASGILYDARVPMNLDPEDGRPVCLELDMEAIARDFPDQTWLDPDRKDMWRYGPLLPATGTEHFRSFGEGWTPLVADPLFGLDLRIKDEGRPHPGYGRNPTGSFKDRGMAMVINMARHYGLDALAVPTQGNAGDSLAWYGHQSQVSVAVIMPDDTPDPIIGNVARLSHIDPAIHLELIKGTIREAGERMKSHWLPKGYFNCATFQEPGWRIEGKKTLGLEIAEQLGWRMPDAIVYPTGGGTGILGMEKAFAELKALGVATGPLPRFYCVQSTQTPPLLKAFDAGAMDTQVQDAGHTLATGLNVPGGVGQFKVLEIVRASNGGVIGVDEDDIASSLTRHYRRTGLWLCPEGAACYTAAERLAETGELARDEVVVIVNTGSFEKYLTSLRHLL